MRTVRKRSEFFDGDVMKEETSRRVAPSSSLGNWTKAENCNEPGRDCIGVGGDVQVENLEFRFGARGVMGFRFCRGGQAVSRVTVWRRVTARRPAHPTIRITLSRA